MFPNLAQFVKQVVAFQATKLFIGQVTLYPTVGAVAQATVGPQGFTENDADALDHEAACGQFRTAGRAGDVIVIKVVRQVGLLEAMVCVWHQPSRSYKTGCGDLLKADGTTDGGDRTKTRCVVVLFVTPEACRRMDQSTLQRVYPPKDAHYFRTEEERGLEVFKR